MEVKIKQTNITLTPDIAGYLDKKLEAFEKFVADDPTAICEVEVGKTTKHHQTGNIFFAEITLTGAGGQFHHRKPPHHTPSRSAPGRGKFDG